MLERAVNTVKVACRELSVDVVPDTSHVADDGVVGKLCGEVFVEHDLPRPAADGAGVFLRALAGAGVRYQPLTFVPFVEEGKPLVALLAPDADARLVAGRIGIMAFDLFQGLFLCFAADGAFSGL